MIDDIWKLNYIDNAFWNSLKSFTGYLPVLNVNLIKIGLKSKTILIKILDIYVLEL